MKSNSNADAAAVQSLLLGTAKTPSGVDYVRHGWALVHIPTGLKGPTHPGWQERANVVTTPERAALLTQNVGLCHAYSGTCAIDIDDMDEARGWLRERGIDLDALLN